jgi:hypothetical protein
VVQLYSEAFDATFHDVISLCGGTFIYYFSYGQLY